MHRMRRAHDAAHWYMRALGARAAALSSRPHYDHHLGQLLLLALRDRPDFVLQVRLLPHDGDRRHIDGSTHTSESSQSVLQRSVRCALGLRALGLNAGDVIVLLAPNHLDLAIPLYAALYLGVITAPMDRTLTVNELEQTFATIQPKVVFCQSEKAGDVQLALNAAEQSAQIVTFDGGDYLCSFQQFLDDYGAGDDTPEDEFEVVDFDPAETVALLIPTSGTTGLPKAAAATHYNFVLTGPYWLASFSSFPCPTRLALVCAPLQWLSAIVPFLMSPLYRYPRLQTPQALTREHAHHLINTYRPSFAVFSPTLMSTLLPRDPSECDFTCFDYIQLGGSSTPVELIDELKALSPLTDVRNVYGLSEATSIAFHPDAPHPAAAGLPLGCLRYRLVDIETQEDITEPDVPGELWLQGPGVFKEYYNNPSATDEAFAADRWLRTGDIFYRDPNWAFYFVERHKLLLKYMSHHISPVELEAVIRAHPGVLDVAVSGVPSPSGDLAVACVVRAEGSDVSADDIKAIVQEKLSDAKQLRGGVIFVDSLPLTASTKLHRRRLKDMVLTMDRE